MRQTHRDKQAQAETGMHMQREREGQRGMDGERKRNSEVGKMVPWVKVLAAKPNNLSVIDGTHMVEGENSLLKVFL